jgi:hypothetical protein
MASPFLKGWYRMFTFEIIHLYRQIINAFILLQEQQGRMSINGGFRPFAGCLFCTTMEL